MVRFSRSRRCALVALCVASLVSPAAAQAPARVSASPAAQPLAPFTWLLGGAWSAGGGTLPGGLDHIETRYDLAPNGHVMRFTTAFVNGDGSVGNAYAGDVYFDPAANRVTMWYVDSQNAITQGAVTAESDAFHVAFRSDGAVIGRTGTLDFRVDVTRRSNDRYDWALFARVAGAWKPVFALQYVRVRDDAPGAQR